MSYITATLNINAVNKKLFVAIGLLAIIGATALWFCTPWGIGLTPDSAMYIGTARGLLAHQGFALPVVDNRYSYVTHYMPAYPAVIALICKCVPRPLESAKIAEVIFFAANIALAGIVIYFATQGSAVAALIGAGLILISPDMLSIHAYALTEGMFLLLIIAAAAVTARSIEQPRIAGFIAAGALLGVSYLTRYMGLAFVAAAGMAIVLLGRAPWRKRLLYATITGATAAIPIIAWMLRNRRLGSETVGRPMVWHPLTLAQLKLGLRTLLALVAPTVGVTLVISTLVALAAAAAAAFFVSRQKSQPTFRSALPRVMGIFATVYVVLLIVGISLFDDAAALNPRLLSPALGCVIVGLCVMGAATSGTSRAIVAAVCAAILVQWSVGSASQLMVMRRDGLGYASPHWLKSQTLHTVRHLPKETLLYSNAWDVLALLDYRPSQTLPTRIIGMSGQTNPTFQDDMAGVVEQVQRHGALIVIFHKLRTRPTLPNESQLKAAMPRRIFSHCDDGVIYAAAAP